METICGEGQTLDIGDTDIIGETEWILVAISEPTDDCLVTCTCEVSRIFKIAGNESDIPY